MLKKLVSELTNEEIKKYENQEALLANKLYDFGKLKMAYVFADGKLLEIVYE